MFVAREADEETVKWYRYWSEIPLKENNKGYSGLSCKYDIVGQIDLASIYDDLMDQYGNIGEPSSLGVGRVIIENGHKIEIPDFHPKLRWVTTWYDEDGIFLGFNETGEFEKDAIVSVGDGYYLIVSGVSCKSTDKYKIYLELVP